MNPRVAGRARQPVAAPAVEVERLRAELDRAHSRLRDTCRELTAEQALVRRLRLVVALGPFQRPLPPPPARRRAATAMTLRRPRWL